MRTAVAAICCCLLAACTSVQPCPPPVEVAKPYWSPPQDIEPLPPRPDLMLDGLPVPQTQEDTLHALQVVAQDFLSLLAEYEQLRHLYAELVRRIQESPPPE